MNCPSCGTPQSQPASRFCDACGLVIPRPSPKRDEPPSVRCGECGLASTTRVCRNCGMRVRWPDDMVPAEEDFGRPPPPSLELPEGEDVDLDDDGEAR